MSLDEIVNFIKNKKEKEIKFTFHAKNRMFERNLNEETIYEYLLNKDPIKIILGKDKIYKLWYLYNNIYDLRIVVMISINKLKIITLIIEDINKRLKNE